MNSTQFRHIVNFGWKFNHLWVSHFRPAVEHFIETVPEIGSNFNLALIEFLKEHESRCQQSQKRGIYPMDCFRIWSRRYVMEEDINKVNYIFTNKNHSIHICITEDYETFEIHYPDILAGDCLVKAVRSNGLEKSFSPITIKLFGLYNRAHIDKLFDVLMAYYGIDKFSEINKSFKNLMLGE